MTNDEIQELLEAFKQGGKHYEDDFLGGEYLTFGYDSTEKSFYINRIDTIVGSYNHTEYCDEQEIIRVLRKY